jgi:hypothetical protein
MRPLSVVNGEKHFWTVSEMPTCEHVACIKQGGGIIVSVIEDPSWWNLEACFDYSAALYLDKGPRNSKIRLPLNRSTDRFQF